METHKEIDNFIAQFLMYSDDLPSLPDRVNEIRLAELSKKARNIQLKRLREHSTIGESIERVIKFYKIKPSKNTRKAHKNTKKFTKI